MFITKPILNGIAWRLILSWLILSAGVMLQGEQIIRPVLPFVTSVIEVIQSDYKARLNINQDQPGIIQMQAVTRRSISGIAARGAKLTAGVQVTHNLVPLVLLFSILMSWPLKKHRQRYLLLMLGIPLSYAIVALTIPFQLAGSIENMLQGYAQQYAVNRDKPWLLSWMLFLEVGGRWLLPVILAVTSCLLMQLIQLTPKALIKRKNKKMKGKAK